VFFGWSFLFIWDWRGGAEVGGGCFLGFRWRLSVGFRLVMCMVGLKVRGVFYWGVVMVIVGL